MVINTRKSRTVLFRAIYMHRPSDLSLTLGENAIALVIAVTALGVCFNGCILWNNHVDLIARGVAAIRNFQHKFVTEATMVIHHVLFATDIN